MHRVLFLTCISYIAISSASTTSYYKICSLKNVKTIKLHKNDMSSKLKFTPSNINDTSITEDNIVEGRMCPCAPKYYCLIDDGSNVCGITHDNEVTCFHISSNLALVRNIWPVIILWYGALFLFFLITPSGKHIQNFLITKLCNKQWNDQLVNQILVSEMQLRQRLREVALMHQRRVCDELILKIKTFDGTPSTSASTTPHSSPEKYMSFDDDEHVSCTICMAQVEHGDKIGALSCNHIFHVECLKQWLKRRNVCPLCLTPDIASSRRRPSNRVLVVNPGLPIDADSPTPPSIPRAESLRDERLNEIRRSLFHFDNFNENGNHV